MMSSDTATEKDKTLDIGGAIKFACADLNLIKMVTTASDKTSRLMISTLMQCTKVLTESLGSDLAHPDTETHSSTT